MENRIERESLYSYGSIHEKGSSLHMHYVCQTEQNVNMSIDGKVDFAYTREEICSRKRVGNNGSIYKTNRGWNTCPLAKYSNRDPGFKRSSVDVNSADSNPDAALSNSPIYFECSGQFPICNFLIIAPESSIHRGLGALLKIRGRRRLILVCF